MLKPAQALLPLVLVGVSLVRAQDVNCEPGKLSSYEKLGAQGCMIDKIKLANVHYEPGLDGLPSQDITITPGMSTDGGDPGVLIEGAWKAPLRHPSSISYTLELPASGTAIAGATLQMQFGQIEGTGEAKVASEVCPIARPGNCGPSGFKVQVVVSAGGERKVSDNGQLRTALRQVDVTSVLSLETGKGGTASFDGFMLIFHLERPKVAATSEKQP